MSVCVYVYEYVCVYAFINHGIEALDCTNVL